MAAPGFLGLLRKHQSDALRGLISEEISKDLSREAPDRIRAQLPEYL
jgi:protein required for attachment to host cells